MISVFDLFKIGIGPSSSHTVGPMKAAFIFAQALAGRKAASVRIELMGSLAWTGKGHGSDKAVILGLAGQRPETADPDAAEALIAKVRSDRRLRLGGHEIGFDPDRDIVFDRKAETPVHPNTLRFIALDAAGAVLADERWCSVGGGFVKREDQQGDAAEDAGDIAFPFDYRSAAQLLRHGAASGLSIAEMVRANEIMLHSQEDLTAYLDSICKTMMACIDRGMIVSGELPGGLAVRRRAPALWVKLEADRFRNMRTPHEIMDHVSLFAIAVNEENAAGGRVVTAPTNGAAGVVPAVLRYYRDFWPSTNIGGMHDFLLTAAAIGGLCKLNASISGAEVGCQGEVGTASAMAAAGLAAALGGSNAQIENAAEIAMEHHLGMTCDPIGGLVQVPCIERNAFGAIKAINAASLALRGDGTHHVSLDRVIATMRQTGADMQSKYKETALGGLAVSFPEC